jgi:hypothetical protein
MRLINKLKRLVGIDVYEYTIFYTDPLSMSDRTKLANNMINKFYFDCSPNRISVSQQTATIDFQKGCMTAEQLKKVSDNTLGPKPADITSIKLNGNEVWHK